MQILKTQGAGPQFLKRMAVQIFVGVVFLAVSSGYFLGGSPGGHEDIGAETSPFESPAARIVERLVAIGGEGARRTPGQQMGLTYSAPSVTKEARRKANNATRLKRIYKPMQPKVVAIINDLEGKGWKPFIDEGVYRTPADQLAKFRRGVSKVTWSFHNATNLDLTPGSLAADIVDTNWGWSNKTPKRYWLQYAASAKAHGLETGCYFGMSTKAKAKQKAALLKAIDTRNFDANVEIGWDPSHTQPRGLSISKARYGARPKF